MGRAKLFCTILVGRLELLRCCRCGMGNSMLRWCGGRFLFNKFSEKSCDVVLIVANESSGLVDYNSLGRLSIGVCDTRGVCNRTVSVVLLLVGQWD